MSDLQQFENQAFLSLATLRKNGQRVLTPVWFAQVGTTLYISTSLDSGKVKRIRSNPAVELNPCTMQGGLLGSWVPARAHVASEQEALDAEAALDARYGEARRDFMRRNPMPSGRRAYLVVQAGQDQAA